MRTLASAPWDFDLVDADGALRLTVVCGTVGIYEITFALDDAERAAWERDGEPYLRALVREVQTYPQRFHGRT